MTEPDDPIVSALRQQLAERRRLLDGGAARVGWKAALGIEEVENRPVIGYLTSATALRSGAAHSAAGAAELCVDSELAVELGRDGALARYAAALELVDLADVGDAEEIVATNVFHRAVAFGPWQRALPNDVAGALVVDGVTLARAAVERDHAEKARAVAALLDAVGEELRAGDSLITGSVVQVEVRPGSQVVADFGELGRVALSLAN
jgi:2-keto-4-pentenoate hydratase